LEFGIGAGVGKKTRMMGLPNCRKHFKIGLDILAHYRRVTDRHPASHPRCRSKYRAYYVARVIIIIIIMYDKFSLV